MAKRFVEYCVGDSPAHLVISLTVDEVRLLCEFTNNYNVCSGCMGFPLVNPKTLEQDPKMLATAEALDQEFTKALERLGQ